MNSLSTELPINIQYNDVKYHFKTVMYNQIKNDVDSLLLIGQSYKLVNSKKKKKEEEQEMSVRKKKSYNYVISVKWIYN